MKGSKILTRRGLLRNPPLMKDFTMSHRFGVRIIEVQIIENVLAYINGNVIEYLSKSIFPLLYNFRIRNNRGGFSNPSRFLSITYGFMDSIWIHIDIIS